MCLYGAIHIFFRNKYMYMYLEYLLIFFIDFCRIFKLHKKGDLKKILT